MKRLALLTALFGTLIIAGAHPGPARSTSTLEPYGWALQETGARCGSTCTAFAQYRLNSGGSAWSLAKSASVSNSSGNCEGFVYNWGQGPFPGGACGPELTLGLRFSVAGLHSYVVQGWIRKACPTGGGYMFSPIHSKSITLWAFNGRWSFDMGTQRVVKPAGGCFASIAEAELMRGMFSA